MPFIINNPIGRLSLETGFVLNEDLPPEERSQQRVTVKHGKIVVEPLPLPNSDEEFEADDSLRANENSNVLPLPSSALLVRNRKRTKSVRVQNQFDSALPLPSTAGP